MRTSASRVTSINVNKQNHAFILEKKAVKETQLFTCVELIHETRLKETREEKGIALSVSSPPSIISSQNAAPPHPHSSSQRLTDTGNVVIARPTSCFR